MATPTAIKIVNDALIHSGQEATFDYKLKNLLLLIVDASLRQGYVLGWKEHSESKKPKITEKELIDFAKLFKKARGI